MDRIQEKLQALYGGKIRVRTSGLLIRNNKLLLLKHEGLGELGYLWLPPGGGLEFGETLGAGLKREFQEEVGLTVAVGNQRFIHEFIGKQFHAIEFFFEVHQTDEAPLDLGVDPELPANLQMIQAYRWMGNEELAELPLGACHQVIEYCKTIEQLMQLSGKINLPNELD